MNNSLGRCLQADIKLPFYYTLKRRIDLCAMSYRMMYSGRIMYLDNVVSIVNEELHHKIDSVLRRKNEKVI